MAGKKKVYDDDDGRTIADMNVEGMPWYDRSHRFFGAQRESLVPLDRSQRRSTVFAVVTAALLIALVFGVAYFLLILLMDLLLK